MLPNPGIRALSSGIAGILTIAAARLAGIAHAIGQGEILFSTSNWRRSMQRGGGTENLPAGRPNPGIGVM